MTQTQTYNNIVIGRGTYNDSAVLSDDEFTSIIETRDASIGGGGAAAIMGGGANDTFGGGGKFTGGGKKPSKPPPPPPP